MPPTHQQQSDEHFMRMALCEAQLALEEGEIPIGAVIVSRGRVIARAHNLTETLHDVTAHAEMQAITAAANLMGGKYLADCILYVTVEPCVMCLWCHRLGTDKKGGVWRGRRKTRIPTLSPTGASSQVLCDVGHTRRRLSKHDAAFFPVKKIVYSSCGFTFNGH